MDTYSLILPDGPSEQSINQERFISTTDAPRREVNDMLVIDKIQNMQREYNHLLTSQLDSQRHYFEEKLKQQKKEINAKPDLQILNHSISELQ